VSAGVSSGDSILVTGGGSGIGEACAELFIERGATVVLLDLDRSAVESTAERLGTRHWVCDVSDEVAVRTAVRAMLAEGINPAGLVHSAGITHPSAGPEGITPDDFSHVMSVDLLGTFLINKSAPP
jgi:NAD(P)-dependent dehydrogenase (short-subunit alcohol dehydrogenase family)